MKECLVISVYASDAAKTASKKSYERMVYLEPSVIVNYQSLISSLRFLYGNSCVIQFELSNY